MNETVSWRSRVRRSVRANKTKPGDGSSGAHQQGNAGTRAADGGDVWLRSHSAVRTFICTTLCHAVQGVFTLHTQCFGERFQYRHLPNQGCNQTLVCRLCLPHVECERGDGTAIDTLQALAFLWIFLPIHLLPSIFRDAKQKWLSRKDPLDKHKVDVSDVFMRMRSKLFSFFFLLGRNRLLSCIVTAYPSSSLLYEGKW